MTVSYRIFSIQIIELDFYIVIYIIHVTSIMLSLNDNKYKDLGYSTWWTQSTVPVTLVV